MQGQPQQENNNSTLLILGNSSSSTSRQFGQLVKSLQRSCLQAFEKDMSALEISQIKERSQQSVDNTSIRSILLHLSADDSIYWDALSQNIENLLEYSQKSKENKQKLDLENETLLKQIRQKEAGYSVPAIDRSMYTSNQLRDKIKRYKKDYQEHKQLNLKYENKIKKIGQIYKS